MTIQKEETIPQAAGCQKDVNAEETYYGGAATVSLSQSLSERHSVRERMTPDAHGVVVAMVGLPARGKSFISRKVERFLQWRGAKTRMFNVGKYRRDFVKPEESGRSEFFDPSNSSAVAARDAAAIAALEDAMTFLDGGGKFAILDATNSTTARRATITQQVQRHGKNYSVIFVEAVCDDKSVLDANIQGKVANSPDFRNMSPEEAVRDLKLRIEKYEKVYETVEDDEGPYIKLFNLSSKVMASHCYGRVAKSILPYLMAIHIGARPIWLVRAGTGQVDPGRAGGDRMSMLSDQGRNFALQIAAFVRDRAEKYWRAAGKPEEPTNVLTSTMPRAVASVCYATREYEQTSALNPIDKGGITHTVWDVECPADTPPWDEVQTKHPEFYEEFQKNPFRCRFPGGESYLDVLNRLEGLLVEVEMCTRPVLIVSHLTTLQILTAYFKGTSIEDVWQLPIPKKAILEVRPTSGGGFQCEYFSLGSKVSENGGPARGGESVQQIQEEVSGFATPDGSEGISKRQKVEEKGG